MVQTKEEEKKDDKYKELHSKFVESNKEFFEIRQVRSYKSNNIQAERAGVNFSEIIEKSSELKWTDYLYPYHLFLDSGEKIVLPTGKEFTLPNTLNMYYRKRRSLLWLYSKQ